MEFRIKQHLSMLADIGSEGYLVVGKQSFDRYVEWLTSSQGYARSDVQEVPTSQIVYRFGAGKSADMRTYHVPMVNFSCEWGSFTSVKVDVLHGHCMYLPWIAGFSFLAQHRIVVIPHMKAGFICEPAHASTRKGTEPLHALRMRRIRTNCSPSNASIRGNACWLSLV